ncbi:MAG: hypothetical protein WDA02_04350 [Saccharofermentanales bacterium]
MAKHTSLANPQTRFIRILALLVASLLLVSCSPAAQNPAGSDKDPTGGTEPVTGKTETPSSIFEGQVGQDWYAFKIPLFTDEVRVRDLAYGAGKLWAVGSQRGYNFDTYRTPFLFSSPDGLNWEQVDLTALGIPEDLTGQAQVLGSDKTITVIFENPRGEDALGDRPQRRPWILRGDGETWRLISEDTFGPWQVNNRGTGKFLHYWDLAAFEEKDGQLLLMPSIGWFEPFATGDRNLSLGIVTADDQAELIADMDIFASSYNLQTVSKVLVYKDEYWAFTNSYMPRGYVGGSLFFNIWRSADGRTWTNETPPFEGMLDYTEINDVVIGPKGLLATGWNANQDDETEFPETPIPISLFSADGTSWTSAPIGQSTQTDFKVAVTDSTYYAYDGEAHIWFSGDGLTWEEASPLDIKKLSADKDWIEDQARDRAIFKILSFPGGLIALSGNRLSMGTHLLFSGDLPFDYLSHK